MYRKLANYLFIILWVSGCAVYPISRTYFEPNPEDGSLSPSMSCGYHAAKNDSLVREHEGFELKITPHYQEGEDLQVTVLVQSKGNNVTINPNKIGLLVTNKEAVTLPSAAKKTYYEPRSNWPYYMKWNHISFPANSESLSSIAIVFNSGSIILNGRPLEVKMFRFSKTTKSDIYYASINC